MCHKYDIYILFKYLKYSDYIATHLMVKPVHCDFWEETLHSINAEPQRLTNEPM